VAQSGVHFSRRTPSDLRVNRIAAVRHHLPPPLDLTVSNPTRVDIPYPRDLLAALADPEGLVYRPHPRGLAAARRAVAQDLGRWGGAVDPERILLTASTSEAYSFLFKLLCEAGDTVLVPAPSYPLFEHLARLEGITAHPYRLDPESGWRVDLSSLEALPRARAVVVVHPNNPTGSLVCAEDREALVSRCAERGWALIADEVFLPYPLGEELLLESFVTESRVLTFTLGGLSKRLGLPQLKLAWIVTSGPAPLVGEALERLELIADSFLSVATPVQLALPSLLAGGNPVAAAIRARCQHNLSCLGEILAHHPTISLHPPAGGWSAVLRIPSVIAEEELVVELLRRDGVGVHPGYFYDFPSEGYLVVSLLPRPDLFAEGVRRLAQRLEALL